MRKAAIILVVLYVSFILLFSSCNAGDLNSKAEETAVAFYNNLQKNNYNAALKLCSDKAFTTATKEQWIGAMRKNAGLLGTIQSFTKTSGFNIETSTTRGTVIKIAYDVQWQYGKSKDSVLMVKEKDGSMKIYRYSWQHSDTKYLAELNASEAQAAKYIDAIKTGDYNTAIGFCAAESLVTTPKEKWIAFLTTASGKLGTITGYDIIGDSSAYSISANGQAGKGNYYDIYIRSNRGGNKVMEKIVFFQKNYEEPVRLAGHSFL